MEAVFAAGVLASQKPVLRNRFFQNLVIFKAASHLHQSLGDGHDTWVGLRGGRRSEINIAISVKNSLVVAAGAVGDWPSVEGFAHPFSGRIVVACPCFAVACACL